MTVFVLLCSQCDCCARCRALFLPLRRTCWSTFVRSLCLERRPHSVRLPLAFILLRRSMEEGGRQPSTSLFIDTAPFPFTSPFATPSRLRLGTYRSCSHSLSGLSAASVFDLPRVYFFRLRSSSTAFYADDVSPSSSPADPRALHFRPAHPFTSEGISPRVVSQASHP
ncbi:hypothetical protein C8R45DRAFT_629234 [Mycena sanguinolenta]|nr:hypothetical protein C8R45DRAFT_629234 [Mycena sanguinolenta]